MNNDEFIDVENPDNNKFPDFSKVSPDYKATLKPGEIIFLSAGWFHDVTSLSDSISITWNFVHREEKEKFYKFLRSHPDDSELDTIRFFLKDHLSDYADVDQITTTLESNLSLQL